MTRAANMAPSVACGPATQGDPSEVLPATMEAVADDLGDDAVSCMLNVEVTTKEWCDRCEYKWAITLGSRTLVVGNTKQSSAQEALDGMLGAQSDRCPWCGIEGMHRYTFVNKVTACRCARMATLCS